MLDFDPELSVAVEGKEILVTLPGANYAVTYLLPALNHLRASTSCLSSAELCASWDLVNLHPKFAGGYAQKVANGLRDSRGPTDQVCLLMNS